MKKIGLFVVLCTLAIAAGAWGLDRTFVSHPMFIKAHGVKNKTNYTSSALYVLLRGGKTDFTVCIDNYAYQNRFNNANQIDNFKLLNQTLPAWITQVRSQIEESGRAAEFADILAWLPSQITLTPATCDKADIRVKVISQRPADRNVWAYDPTLGTWQLLFTYGENALADAWQESGSFWGLGVLTDTFEPQTVATGRFKNTTDKQHSIYSVVESHPTPGASVMWWKQPSAVSITCDDVEGFINAVDYVQFMEGESSARLKNGWKSLCGHPYYYLRGQATASEEGLAVLRQATALYREEGQTLNTLQQLLGQWKTYQQEQVIPALSKYRKLLAQQPRPLDDKGLMLSAQVNHLEQVSDSVFEATHRIETYGAQWRLCKGTDCPALRAELAQLNFTVGMDPLQIPGLQEATPLPQDYLTGTMHTCAACGKQIEVEADRHETAYVRNKKQGKYVWYYRHKTCPSVSSECAQAYQDNPVQKQAPTYAQLQARIQQADSLAANKPTVMPTGDITLPFQGDIPDILKRSVATSVAKATTPAVPQAKATTKTASTESANTAAKHSHSRAIGTVLPGEKVHCSVCGEEIHEGETYYKRTESQFMHRGGQCAYSFFAKKHGVDENSLATYSRSYSFETPAEVASARADMKALGLSVEKVRQLRAQEEAVAQQQAQQRMQEQKRQEARTQLNTQCRVYLKVTAQDVARFKTLHAKQLARIESKTKKHQKLTRQQARLRKQYKQLLQDEKKTQECLELEQAAR